MLNLADFWQNFSWQICIVQTEGFVFSPSLHIYSSLHVNKLRKLQVVQLQIKVVCQPAKGSFCLLQGKGHCFIPITHSDKARL